MAIMSVCTQAQVASLKNMKSATVLSSQSEQTVHFSKNRFDRFASAVDARRKAPVRRKAELAKNERLLGLYTTDDYNMNGKAISNDGSKFKVLSIIPSSYYTRLTEGRITAIRFALSNACRVNKVFVMGVTANDEIYTISESFAGKTYNAGWNTVKLTAPVPVKQDYDRLAIGFEFVDAEGAYPLSLVDGYSDEGFILIGDLGEGESIYNASQEGLLSVQAIVQLDNLAATDVVLEDMLLSASNVAAGTLLQYGVIAYNFGSENVTSYEIAIKMDGNLINTLTEKDHVMGKDADMIIGGFTLPADFARGKHTLSAEVVKVNGSVPLIGKADDQISCSFSSYMSSDVVERQKHLIEEMTSHSCTYCPNGAQLLEIMAESVDNLAIACVHGNQQSKDPFNTAECQSILAYTGSTVFPSATFNRIYFSPQEGIVPGIGYSQQVEAYAAEFYNIMENYSMPSFATVDIDKALSADGKTLSINVSGVGGEAANVVLNDFSLTVYVLEDSLKYRQLNNGAWVSNYIHNHVLRKVATAINGDDLKWVSSSKYENSYEVALDDSWNRNQLSIVAFISKKQSLDKPDWTDMEVSNANSVKVTESIDGGIKDDDEDVRVDAGIRITPFTTGTQLMGEGMSPNGKYVTGLNYGTQSPSIWNSETGDFVNFTQYAEGLTHAVNSNGTAVGTTHSYGGKGLVCNADGSSYTLNDNGGANTQGVDAWCISEDGKTIGGFYYYFEWTNAEQTEGYFATFPCVWKDKKCIDLPYPKSSDMGFNVDGAGLRWMSSDGSVLLGYLVDDKATWPAVVWRKNAAGSYDCDPICKDYFEVSYKHGKPYMMFNPTALSANGEWVALNIQDEFDDSNFDNPAPMVKVARYNLKTGKMEILESAQAMSASSIANDGSVLLYTNIDGIYGREGFMWKAGQTSAICLDDMLNKVKGVPAFGANVPASFGSDCQTFMGYGIDEDANIFSYVLNLATLEKALNDANGIKGVETESNVAAAKRGIYTIAGRKVSEMKQPGLYIVNGKKILKK